MAENSAAFSGCTRDDLIHVLAIVLQALTNQSELPYVFWP